MTDIKCENYSCKHLDECSFCSKKSIILVYNKYIISGVCGNYEKRDSRLNK